MEINVNSLAEQRFTLIWYVSEIVVKFSFVLVMVEIFECSSPCYHIVSYNVAHLPKRLFTPNQDYTEFNDRMTDEWQIGKNLEGCSHGLIEVLMEGLRKTMKNHSQDSQCPGQD
jgi:hypothetical protein